mmetsp:Transcript_32959/g.76658  ORF Transcript_32959/g.76658 Transcript_32959/m.76658 type:complete len:192 (+) Transcript_32959:76-651(+)
MFCVQACTDTSEPVSGPIKVDTSAIEQQREERERQLAEEESAEERAKLKEEEQAKLDEEEQAKLEEDRLKEEERLQREQQEQARQRELEERQEALSQFYARFGFTGVNKPKKSGWAVLGTATTFPLHCAAELGDERITTMLLKEGAVPSQKDSSGRTAVQVAQRKNRKGSHDGVLFVLGAPAAKPCGAGGA